MWHNAHPCLINKATAIIAVATGITKSCPKWQLWSTVEPGFEPRYSDFMSIITHFSTSGQCCNYPGIMRMVIALWFNNGAGEESVTSNQADTTSQVAGNTEGEHAKVAHCPWFPIGAWCPREGDQVGFEISIQSWFLFLLFCHQLRGILITLS